MENIFPSIEAAGQGSVELPGTEAFLGPISNRQDCNLLLVLKVLLWTFCEFQRAEQLLSKEGCSRRDNRVQIFCDPMDTK